jgi:hypothetical protein
MEKELSGSIFAHLCASFLISHIGTKQVVDAKSAPRAKHTASRKELA